MLKYFTLVTSLVSFRLGHDPSKCLFAKITVAAGGEWIRVGEDWRLGEHRESIW